MSKGGVMTKFLKGNLAVRLSCLREEWETMKRVLKTAVATVFTSAIMAEQAFAWCFMGWGPSCGGGGGGGGGWGHSVPEIDGPAGIAAIALVVSGLAVLYNRTRR
jgi:hypothetical protein